MYNQYEVLGAAPEAEDLKKLSPKDVHLTIKNLSAGYGKMEILHNLDLFVSRAQSLCLIGPNGAGKSTILHSIYGFTNIFSGEIEIDGREITKLTPAEKLKSEGYKGIKIIKKPGIGETIAEHIELKIGDETVIFIYKPYKLNLSINNTAICIFIWVKLID